MNRGGEEHVEDNLRKIADMRETLIKQEKLARKLLWGITPDGPIPPIIPTRETISADMTGALIAMLSCTLISCNSLLILTKEPDSQIRDCYSISRSIVEALLNITYILADETALNKAMRHARQKSYRDLDRTTQIAGNILSMKYEGKPDVDDIPGMRDMLNEFTSARGREKNWTDFSINQRLGKVGEVFGNKAMFLLQSSIFGIYRHSSEIIHGTPFGALYFYGLTTPRGNIQSLEEGKNIVLRQLILIFLCVQTAFTAFMLCIDKRYGFPEMAMQSEDLLREILRTTIGKQ